jgi:hypothetical protein
LNKCAEVAVEQAVDRGGHFNPLRGGEDRIQVGDIRPEARSGAAGCSHVVGGSESLFAAGCQYDGRFPVGEPERDSPAEAAARPR